MSNLPLTPHLLHPPQDNDENKLIYTELFSKYTELIESNIESRLAAEVPGFDMGDFLRLLDAHKEELMGDVFDLLLTMGCVAWVGCAWWKALLCGMLPPAVIGQA